MPETTLTATEGKVSQRLWTFVMALFKGMNQTEAYLTIAPKMARETAWSAGSRLASNVKVKAMLEEMRGKESRKAVLSRERVSEIREEIATDKQATNADRLRAMKDEESMQAWTKQPEKKANDTTLTIMFAQPVIQPSEQPKQLPSSVPEAQQALPAPAEDAIDIPEG